MNSNLTITTLETVKTDGGLILKLREKKVSGEHTVYQVMQGRTPSDFGMGFEGSYTDACDYMDWYVNGCNS